VPGHVQSKDTNVVSKKEQVNGIIVHRECMRRKRVLPPGQDLECDEIHLLEKTGHGLKKKISSR
jgi:hypothetical protein